MQSGIALFSIPLDEYNIFFIRLSIEYHHRMKQSISL